MNTPLSVTAEEAVAHIQSGQHIHISSVANAPQCLIKALCERAKAESLHDIYIHHLHTEGPAPYAEPECEGLFKHEAFFVGSNVRASVNRGQSDYIPIFLGETARLYRDGYVPCDTALIQVAPPDEEGYVSLGPSVDATIAAIETAKTVIAVVNPNVPYTYGDARIHISRIHMIVHDTQPLFMVAPATPSEQDQAIGRHCAALIEDGSCLQLGIGTIPNAVLASLSGHKDLGIHTEMFSDGILSLVERGVINGARKTVDRGKIVSTFVMGTQRIYDFLHHNEQVLMKDVAYTNDPFVIARQDKMVSINSGLQIDLTGQVCADSLGTRIYSGCGGQVDFIYGASRSNGGRAIIAMPSVTNKGISKIVPTLSDGAGVVTTRAHIHWFVTEYGAVNLYGKSLQERARLIISVAAPQFREELAKAAYERFGKHGRYIQ